MPYCDVEVLARCCYTALGNCICALVVGQRLALKPSLLTSTCLHGRVNWCNVQRVNACMRLASSACAVSSRILAHWAQEAGELPWQAGLPCHLDSTKDACRAGAINGDWCVHLPHSGVGTCATFVRSWPIPLREHTVHRCFYSNACGAAKHFNGNVVGPQSCGPWRNRILPHLRLQCFSQRHNSVGLWFTGHRSSFWHCECCSQCSARLRGFPASAALRHRGTGELRVKRCCSSASAAVRLMLCLWTTCFA